MPVDVELDLKGVLFSDIEGTSSIFLRRLISYPDGHGYHQHVDIVAGPFRGSIRVIAYEHGGLQAFADRLQTLHQNLRGIAQLPHTYDDLRMTLEGDGLGHVKVEALARVGGQFETLLKFGFRMDQTQLPTIIAAIKRLAEGSN